MKDRVETLDDLCSCGVDITVKCRQQFPNPVEKRSHYILLLFERSTTSVIVSFAKCCRVILKKIIRIILILLFIFSYFIYISILNNTCD